MGGRRAALLALTAVLGVAQYAQASTPPYTETMQLVRFYNVTPRTEFTVRWTVSHTENDPFVYLLGGSAWSGAAGTVTSLVGLHELAYGYGGGGEKPVYEVHVCLYQGSDVLGLFPPIACTDDTYVGYYPEPYWYYTGAPRG
jgi:hypothetical protein